ncbi:unnamed protein product [Callosobruchus maculatus]|uniref:Uncharacterized protein n=1 Tax=Callosobruchus maculatus TaxID=64391 RepID=A0A653DBM1_CALMS|nr:unnamed protein product [Callosobruchus maculatus]
MSTSLSVILVKVFFYV